MIVDSITFYWNPFFLANAPILFISVSILCELDMLPEVYMLSYFWEKEVRCSSWGDRCTHLEAD